MELQVGKICNSQQIVFSRALPNDLDDFIMFVKNFKTECDGLLFSEEDLVACPESPGHPLAQLKASLLNENSFVALAKKKGVLVGFLKFDRGQTSKSRHRGVFTMAVTRSHWGMGVGTGLLKFLEDWANNEGVIRLELNVLENNLRAIRLYQKEGYIIEGQKQFAALVNGTFLGGYWMSKILHRFDTLSFEKMDA